MRTAGPPPPARAGGYRAKSRPALGASINSPPVSLLDGVLKHERVGDETLSGPQTRLQLLQGIAEHVTAGDLSALERAVPNRHVDPVAIVQVEHRGGWHHGARLGRAAVERRGDEHADAQETGV